MVILHPSILGEKVGEACCSMWLWVPLISHKGLKKNHGRISLGKWKLWDEQEGQIYHGVWGKVGDHPDREDSVCEALRQEGGWNVWSR